MPHSENKTHTSSAFDFVNGVGGGGVGISAPKLLTNWTQFKIALKDAVSVWTSYIYLSIYASVFRWSTSCRSP